MAKKEKTRDAVSILHGRYIKDDPERRAALQEERINAEVARLIHDMRTDAGLSQQQLAELIGTTQSVVSRLEDSDYEGRSLTMLDRIARALNQKLTVVMTAREPESEDVREAFPRVIQMLRRSRGFTIGMLSEKANIDKTELTALERTQAYRPTPLTLHRLSQFFDIPHRKLAVLAGAIKEASEGFREKAIQFAAQSDSFSKLTKEEQKILDDFVNLLREDK
jgi:transcriptional regulator with XRE-family HTH domain